MNEIVESLQKEKSHLQLRYNELGELIKSERDPSVLRRLRLEQAAVGEEIVDLNRRLREETPKHKVARRRSWGSVDGENWDRLQLQTWKELEQAEPDPDGHTDRIMMQRALNVGHSELTEKQMIYLDCVSSGQTQKKTGEKYNRDKSVISRTVARARANLNRDVKSAYQLQKSAYEWGGDETPIINLRDPETLGAYLALLTPRQQLYITLYYGEGMSLREVGAYADVDHSAVCRGIHRGISRLSSCFCGESVEVEGLDALEELIINYYKRAGTEDSAQNEDSTENHDRKHNRKRILKKRPPLFYQNFSWSDQEMKDNMSKMSVSFVPCDGSFLEWIQSLIPRGRERKADVGKMVIRLFRLISNKMSEFSARWGGRW